MNILRQSFTVLRLSCSFLSQAPVKNVKIVEQGLTRLALTRCIHTNPKLCSLDEFFDKEIGNYELESIHVGRPWRLDELRLKSNEDLHKLWYVMLKERNMLMTMEQLAYDQQVPLAGPERIFKVEEGMENILSVIKERDVAYNILNFNKTGESKKRVVRNFAGIPVLRREKEHILPIQMNLRHRLLNPQYRKWMYKHIAQYEQKLRRKYKFQFLMCKKKRRELLRKFPHLKPEDVEHIKPDYKQLKEFLKLSTELNDQDFAVRKVY